jgi:hypothetical protein
MVRFWGRYAGVGAAAVALGLALSPASGEVSNLLRFRASNPATLGHLGSIYSFTPSTKDERLAAVYARAVLVRNTKSFRFTPTSGSVNGRRSITVLVRADTPRSVQRSQPSTSVGIAPLAFSLDVSRGWRKLGFTDSLGRKPLDPVATDLPNGAASFSLDRVKRKEASLDTRRDEVALPKALVTEQKNSADLASSYSLTRNLNVTAGVRRTGPDDRVKPITDKQQDSQAVYLGTTFKF